VNIDTGEHRHMNEMTAAKIILALSLVGVRAAAVDAQAPAASSPSRTSILPAPTGSYGVGVVAHAVTDPRRREIFTPDTSDVRRFPVRVFYPVAKGACAPGAYFPPRLAEPTPARMRRSSREAAASR
jgi:hypothetical protein